MRKSVVLFTFLLILALALGAAACGSGEETAPTLTPVATPTPTEAPALTPTPTPEPVTNVFNITRQLSGLDITLVMASWTGNNVDILWRIENHSGQKFKASRLYSIFYPGAYVTDQSGKEAEYFVSKPITEDLAVGDYLLYHTQYIFYPGSTDVKIRLPDVYSDGSTFVDISVDYTFPR